MTDFEIFPFQSDSVDYDMESLYTRCSICFDAHLDFCLRGCKDQFCRHCFERYVAESVRNSWGLSVQKIKCPVCSDPIEQDEWRHYVSSGLVEQYNRYNKPYRALTRACEHCDTVVECVQAPSFDRVENEKKYLKVYSIAEELLAADGRVTSYTFGILNRLEANYHNQLRGGAITVYAIYDELISDLHSFLGLEEKTLSSSPLQLPLGHPDQKSHRMLSEISYLLVSLETRPEYWRTLQFRHVRRFPQISCSSCSVSLCFSCGETPFHYGSTCTEHMTLKAESQGPADVVANITWKLRNSKRCPNCFILINREEGCNKVDCLFCGHAFCWNCLGAFENGSCGYYRCQLGTTTSEGTKDEKVVTELGVPNVMDIEAKWQRRIAHH